jgi:hypothetical protein
VHLNRVKTDKRQDTKTDVFQERYFKLKLITMRKLHAIVFSLITVVSFGQDQTPVEGDYVIEDFQFESGESLPKLNLHYRTIGKPTKGTDGKLITQY